MTALSDKDRFQAWLMEMDSAIEVFLADLPPMTRSRLDGAIESLNALEEVILSRFDTVASARRPESARFLDGAARYVGEVIRGHSDAKWSIRFDDRRFVFHGLPILVGGGALKSMPECPLTLVTASVDRRTGHYISDVVRRLVKQP